MPIKGQVPATQDWTPMNLGSKGASGGASGGGVSKNAAQKNVSQFDKKTAALDNATEPAGIEKMPRNIIIQLVAARVAKKLSQKQLAQMMNFDLKTIQDIESYRANKDMALAQKIARKLGITLVK